MNPNPPTDRLEYVYRVLDVAHRRPGEALSVSAIRRYAEIVGVREPS
jgi:hypothetical protein